MIKIEQTQRIDDKTGREVTRFTPVFYPDCTANGGPLRFACWEAWSDDVAGCNDAEVKAVANVKDVFLLWAAELLG